MMKPRDLLITGVVAVAVIVVAVVVSRLFDSLTLEGVKGVLR